ncbi:MAG: hypothetical protein WA610_08505 [Thermodesulfovibrionales bacterium]
MSAPDRNDPRMTQETLAGGWVANSKKTNGLLFGELDLLLRALDRFFTIENLTASNDELTTRNFYDELTTVRDVILRVLGILEVVIPESKKNAYWFQKFAETKYLTARDRDSFRENLYKQDNPEKGLYLLYDSFINLKGVLADILRSGTISYMGFTNIGHMIDKEIRENRYFNPFAKDINPEFDVISNAEISEIVKGLNDRDYKKHISIIFLYLFRFLRYLGFIDVAAQRTISLHTSLIILILLRSEINTFHVYVEKAIRKIGEQALSDLLQALSYQFSMESRRVFQQELRDIHRQKATPHFRGRIENSHGILKNLTEQSIVQLADYFKPGARGEELFVSYLTKVQQSMRLREDIVVLHRFVVLIETRAGRPAERVRAFESLKNYMVYFESFTFRLLRHDDYEEFARFFSDMHAVRQETLSGEGSRKVTDKISYFKIYLETTLRHIENRSELSGKNVDMERVENLLGQYL